MRRTDMAIKVTHTPLMTTNSKPLATTIPEQDTIVLIPSMAFLIDYFASFRFAGEVRARSLGVSGNTNMICLKRDIACER